MLRHAKPVTLEITHVITDQFLRKLLMPGFLFPDQLPLKNGCFQFEGNFYPDTNPHALLALNKYLLPTYERLLWEENVWVIGPGYDWHTLKFIERIPDTYMRIKRVYLTFTTEDLCGASELMLAMIELARDANGNLKLSAAELLERFTSHCDDTSRELTTIWRTKLSAMTFLALDDLTLEDEPTDQMRSSCHAATGSRHFHPFGTACRQSLRYSLQPQRWRLRSARLLVWSMHQGHDFTMRAMIFSRKFPLGKLVQ